MGVSPDAIDRMSLWQYRAMLAGWNAQGAKGDEAPAAMSAARYEQLLASVGRTVH